MMEEQIRALTIVDKKRLRPSGLIPPHHASSSRVEIQSIRVIRREVPTTRAGTLSFSSGPRCPIQIRTGGGKEATCRLRHAIGSEVLGYMKERK